MFVRTGLAHRAHAAADPAGVPGEVWAHQGLAAPSVCEVRAQPSLSPPPPNPPPPPPPAPPPSPPPPPLRVQFENKTCIMQEIFFLLCSICLPFTLPRLIFSFQLLFSFQTSKQRTIEEQGTIWTMSTVIPARLVKYLYTSQVTSI